MREIDVAVGGLKLIGAAAGSKSDVVVAVGGHTFVVAVAGDLRIVDAIADAGSRVFSVRPTVPGTSIPIIIILLCILVAKFERTFVLNWIPDNDYFDNSFLRNFFGAIPKLSIDADRNFSLVSFDYFEIWLMPIFKNFLNVVSKKKKKKKIL